MGTALPQVLEELDVEGVALDEDPLVEDRGARVGDVLVYLAHLVCRELGIVERRSARLQVGAVALPAGRRVIGDAPRHGDCRDGRDRHDAPHDAGHVAVAREYPHGKGSKDGKRAHARLGTQGKAEADQGRAENIGAPKARSGSHGPDDEQDEASRGGHERHDRIGEVQHRERLERREQGQHTDDGTGAQPRPERRHGAHPEGDDDECEQRDDVPGNRGCHLVEHGQRPAHERQRVGHEAARAAPQDAAARVQLLHVVVHEGVAGAHEGEQAQGKHQRGEQGQTRRERGGAATVRGRGGSGMHLMLRSSGPAGKSSVSPTKEGPGATWHQVP